MEVNILALIATVLFIIVPMAFFTYHIRQNNQPK